MRIKLIAFMMVVVSFSNVQNSLSQSQQKQQPLTVVDFGDQINEPFSAKELAQLQEVYGPTLQENVLDHPQRVKDFKHILRNRIEIVDAGSKDLSGLTKLSSVDLFKDFVPTVSKDLNFNPESFNPLKYKFNFFSRNSYIYHVDNTSYYIRIKSQYE